jgi:hypothetical protein
MNCACGKGRGQLKPMEISHIAGNVSSVKNSSRLSRTSSKDNERTLELTGAWTGKREMRKPSNTQTIMLGATRKSSKQLQVFTTAEH